DDGCWQPGPMRQCRKRLERRQLQNESKSADGGEHRASAAHGAYALCGETGCWLHLSPHKEAATRPARSIRAGAAVGSDSRDGRGGGSARYSARVFRTAETANAPAKPTIAMTPPRSSRSTGEPPSASTHGSRATASAPAISTSRSSVGPNP